MTEAYKGNNYETIKAWLEDGIGYMQFNRPKAMNAVNLQLLQEAAECLQMYNDDPEVRAIIICGNDKVFAAGADLKAVATMNAFEARDYDDWVHKCLFAVEDNHKPTIAAVQGIALGGGMELVLASDIRIVSDDATLGLPEINVGIFPGGGATQRMPRNTSMCNTKQYIFTGDFFKAEDAYRMGLVNMVVPNDKVMEMAQKMARKIMKKSPLALREAKNAINMSMNLDIKAGCRMEQLGWSMLFSSEDQKEGMKAFAENRKAVFVGK
ncbi:MAG: enoyl-CoA hydratase/isomerase family protein [Bacillota bacterium]|nr:enoyl-CoA hydratase/isomerase family protein [Bacillota bacterium]